MGAQCLHNPAFQLLAVVHILIWVFVMFAFLSEKTARINLTLVIPAIYLVHLLPFHAIEEAKKSMCGGEEESTEAVDRVSSTLIMPKLFTDLQKQSKEHCTASPISPQGMLVFGCLSSAHRLLRK